MEGVIDRAQRQRLVRLCAAITGDRNAAGKLQDVALDEEEMERALHAIEGLPAPV